MDFCSIRIKIGIFDPKNSKNQLKNPQNWPKIFVQRPRIPGRTGTEKDLCSIRPKIGIFNPKKLLTPKNSLETPKLTKISSSATPKTWSHWYWKGFFCSIGPKIGIFNPKNSENQLENPKIDQKFGFSAPENLVKLVLKRVFVFKYLKNDNFPWNLGVFQVC